MPEIRRATVADTPALVRLRLALCAEVEGRSAAEATGLAEATERFLAEKLASGEFLAWVAVEAGEIVSMSGLIFFAWPPTIGNLVGLDARIMNMYTVPAWRRRGLASRLVQEIIAYVRTTPVRTITLHASEDGKPVYAAAGFVPVDSMMELTLH